jgi:hypothetical protein
LNGDNLYNERRDACRHFKDAKRGCLKDKINEPEVNSNNNHINTNDNNYNTNIIPIKTLKLEEKDHNLHPDSNPTDQHAYHSHYDSSYLPCFFKIFDVEIALLLRLLAGSFPPRRSGLEPGAGHMGFMVDKAELGQVFSQST